MRATSGHIIITFGFLWILFCNDVQLALSQGNTLTAAGNFSTDFRFRNYNDEKGNRKPDPVPEQIYGPIYSVGPLTVCVYLLKTSEGLVLFDAGYASDSSLVSDNIRKLGFDPAEIKKIFITHWHGDHSSGAGLIAKLSGAEIMVHRLDAAAVREIFCRNDSNEAPVGNIREIEDGQVVSSGDAEIKVIHTPGQSAGEVVYLVTVNGPQGECRALVAGDATGFKADVEDFERFKYPGVCRDYDNSVSILKSIEFDLYLGGHPHQVYNEMREDGFPFVTRDQWHKMVDNRSQEKITFLKAHPEYADY